MKTIVIVILFTVLCNKVMAAFEIRKHSINNGGTGMTSFRYKIQGSVGQVDASKTMSQDSFKLNGGYWHKLPSQINQDSIFSNGFE